MEKLAIIKEYIKESKERRAEIKSEIDSLVAEFRAGKISRDEFLSRMAVLREKLKALALASEKLGELLKRFSEEVSEEVKRLVEELKKENEDFGKKVAEAAKKIGEEAREEAARRRENKQNSR